MSAGTGVNPHVHGTALIVVTHHVGHLLKADLLSRLHKERQTVVSIVTHRKIEILLSGTAVYHTVTQNVVRSPYSGLAASHAAESERSVCVAETEFLVSTLEVTHLAGEIHHVLRIQPVLGVIEIYIGDTGLVGMGTDVSVRNTRSHPDDALADIAALPVQLAALSDKLHNPHLVLVGNRERLSAGGVTVLVSQIRDNLYGLAGCPGPLKSDIDERAVIHDTVRVIKLGTASVCGLGDDELVLIHVAHSLISPAYLGYLPEETACVPLGHIEHDTRFEESRRSKIQLSVELV